MSFLQTYLLRMAVFLVLVAIAAAFIAPGLQDAFLANVWLNGLILLILLVGIVYSFVQVLRLRGEIYWLETLRSEEHTSELQSLMRISYAVFCLKKKTHNNTTISHTTNKSIDI